MTNLILKRRGTPGSGCQAFNISPKKMLFAFRRPVKERLNAVCVSCTRPQDDGRLIVFTKHWKALLHPNQSSLGSVLIVTLRHVSKVGLLTRTEMSDFHQLYGQLESTLERTFGASLVNLSCERNLAYRERNPDPPFLDGHPNPHVHWHVVPRYKQKVQFMGLEWEDPTFGQPFLWRQKEVPQDVTAAIIKSIRKPLPIMYVKRGQPAARADAAQRPS